MTMFAQQRFLWLSGFLLFALLGCERSQEDKPGRVVEPYSPPDPGFLMNAEFTPDGAGKLPHWALSQHSSNTSYALSLEEQGVVIERTGVEPWGKLRQNFSRADIKPLLGKTLAFSAELKGSFTDEYGEPMEPPALTVLVKGVRKGTPAMMGSSVVLSEKAQMTAVPGEHDWQRYSVTFTLPAADLVQGTQLEVAILHTMGGKLYARGPALTEVSTEASEEL